MKVISVIQADSTLSAREIAKKSKMQTHSVIYTLQKLKSRNVIYPYILTNPHAINLTDYCIFFNCFGNEKRTREKVIEHFTHSKKVSYFAELTGLYQFSVSLFCRNVFEVHELFEGLKNKLPKSSFELSFAIRMRFAQILRNYLNPLEVVGVLDRTKVKKILDVDSDSQELLGFCSQNINLSFKEIANKFQISESTVRNKLAKLEASSVILAFPYFIDFSQAGFHSFRVLLKVKGVEGRLHRKLYEFALSHSKASAFVSCMGAWDFELNFMVESASEIGQITSEVNDSFASNIRSMFTLTEVAVHRAHYFPLIDSKIP